MKKIQGLIMIKVLERGKNTAAGGPMYKGIASVVNSNYGPDDEYNLRIGFNSQASYRVTYTDIIVKCDYHFTKNNMIIDYIY